MAKDTLLALFFLVFFHLFSSTISANSCTKIVLKPLHMPIIEKFIEGEIIKRPLGEIEIFTCPSSVTTRYLYKITDANKNKVALKEFNSIEAYNKELYSWQNETRNMIDFFKKMKKSTDKKLPALIDFLGAENIDGRGVIAMSAASGRTLEDIFEPLKYVGRFFMTKTQAQEYFQNMGEQISHLDILLSQQEKPLKLWFGEGHSGNLVYDADLKQLFLIDFTEEFKFVEREKNAPFLLNSISITPINELKLSYFISERNKLLKNKWLNKDNIIHTHFVVETLLLGINAFFSAYLKTIKYTGISGEAFAEEYNNLLKTEFLNTQLKEFNSYLSEANLEPINLEDYLLK